MAEVVADAAPDVADLKSAAETVVKGQADEVINAVGKSTAPVAEEVAEAVSKTAVPATEDMVEAAAKTGGGWKEKEASFGAKINSPKGRVITALTVATIVVGGLLWHNHNKEQKAKLAEAEKTELPMQPSQIRPDIDKVAVYSQGASISEAKGVAA